jgi:uncharacterized membrane protein
MYLFSIPVFFVIDMLWLGVIAPKFYKAQIGHLLSSTVNWWVVLLFYLLFLIGLVIFAIAPAVEAKSWTYALMYGALFGFFTYLTYDLTNWATLKEWPALVSIVDIVWGTFLSATVATVTYFLVTTFIVR